MAESTVVRHKRDGVIILKSSGGSFTYTVAYEEGNFSFDIPLETVENYLDRGRLADSVGGTPSIRKGDDQPITGSFTAYLRDIGDTGATYATLPDIGVRFTSGYVATNWTSTIGNASDVETITIDFTIDGTPFGESDKTLSFTFAVIRTSFAEGSPDTVSATFTSYILRPVLS